jgi:hypothetical protein
MAFHCHRDLFRPYIIINARLDISLFTQKNAASLDIENLQYDESRLANFIANFRLAVKRIRIILIKRKISRKRWLRFDKLAGPENNCAIFSNGLITQ